MSTYHLSNRNLVLCEGKQWNGLPLQEKYSPFILSYLESMLSIFKNAIIIMQRVCVIRFDLHLPDSYIDNSSVISRFTSSLKAQLEASYQQRLRTNPKAHHSKLGYIWTREYGINNKPHYHLVILLNADAYGTLGTIPLLNTINSQQFTADNMACRIMKAWASALQVNIIDAYKLVHFPEKCNYRIGIFQGVLDIAGFENMFHRMSYLAKANTKEFGNHQRNFGTSQLMIERN